MTRVDGTKIEMTRGDTFIATLTLQDANGNAYTPAENDSIRFAAKRRFGDSEVLIRKTISNTDLVLMLEPADTKQLKFGPYVYDIQITFADGRVDTVIDKGVLILTEEVD